MKSVSTRLELDAQTNRFIGTPIFRAIYPAKMLPKLPVGTVTLTGSPNLIAPAFKRSQYADA